MIAALASRESEEEEEEEEKAAKKFCSPRMVGNAWEGLDMLE